MLKLRASGKVKVALVEEMYLRLTSGCIPGDYVYQAAILKSFQ